MLEELDLKILKAITTDKISALTFCHKYDSDVFDDDSRRFAKLTLDYIKHFHAPPTRRTLLDRHRNSTNLADTINTVWDELDGITYDVKEFNYDVGEIKNRYKERAVERLRDLAASDDPDNPTNPEEYFNNISMALARINSFESGNTHTQKPVGDFVDEFKESYEARLLNPEVSIEIPTGFSIVDTVSPFCPGELIIVGAETGKGKALDINTKIITPTGWTTMGEIKPGDVVFGDDGNPCNVVAVSGIMENHECYELEFSTGEKVIADAGHLWKVYNCSERATRLKRTDEYRTKERNSRKSKGKGLRPWMVKRNQEMVHKTKEPAEPGIRTTEDIFKTYLCPRKDKRKNYSIPLSLPLNYIKKDLKVDPYVLGAWLGDGTSRCGAITSADIEIINEISNAGFEVKKITSKYGWSIHKLMPLLRELNLYRNKHIPDIYLQGSFEQRLSLLQGLMDTDGTVTGSNTCQFTTIKEDLRDGFLELVRSLGIAANLQTGIAKLYGKVIGPKYNITFKTTLPAFRLPRKLEKQKMSGFQFLERFIVSVKRVESVHVQCIQVDSSSNCFLCGEGMIPTHNSMLLNGAGKNIWLQGNTIDTDPYCFSAGKNVLYFSLEMSYDMCFNRFLASLANIPQTALRKAKLDPEQTERKDKALEFIKKYQEAGHYFDIVDVPRNVTIEEVELRYQEAILRYEPDVVIIDYLTLMGSDALAKEADWLRVGGIAASLHEFARSKRCVVVTAAQLTDIKRNAQGSSADENKTIGVHRFGRSSLIIHNVDSAVQIETRNNEDKLPDMIIHYVKNRKGPLAKGHLIKNFANAMLIDVPYDQNELAGDISANIPDLIRSIQEAKNNG